jgi:uncharacterized protein YidB (DUF937 family)
MNWSDLLQQSIASLGGQGSSLPEILKSVLAGDGLQSILAKLREAGLNEHVSSWLDPKRLNLPISTDQLQAALGNEQVRKLAASLGLPVDSLLAALREHVPQAASASSEETDDNDKS